MSLIHFFFGLENIKIKKDLLHYGGMNKITCIINSKDISNQTRKNK